MPQNPNLSRRRLPALLLALAAPGLGLLIALLRKRPSADDRVTLYQSYQVGDFYMALPALRSLAARLPVRVLCRPDCAFLLRRLGIEALPFENPFQTRPGLAAFLTGVRNARALPPLGRAALDFHADPRSAFLLKLAGARTVHSYRRPHGRFIDVEYRLPESARHQSEKDRALAEAFSADADGSAGRPETQGNVHDTGNAMVTDARMGAGPAAQAARPTPERPTPETGHAHASASGTGADGGIVISCWTRKDEKNWPLESWDVLLAALSEQASGLCVLVPPDGDAAFRAFRARHNGVEFLAAGLEAVHDRVSRARGVICTDNFLGHMAAHLGKPVLWINGSSDPEHVRPYGPRTEVVQVEAMPCRPCGHRCVNPIHKQCLAELRPEAVVARAERWLRGLPQPGPGEGSPSRNPDGEAGGPGLPGRET